MKTTQIFTIENQQSRSTKSYIQDNIHYHNIIRKSEKQKGSGLQHEIF